MINSNILITKTGNTIHYLMSGRGDKKIVFIHGNLASSIWWMKTFENINKGYEAYAIDLPGSGKSPETGIRHTIDYLSDFVIDFIESLKINHFFLVGHSMGGGVAQLFTINHPEYVIKLALVDSMAMDGYHGLLYYSNELSKSLMYDKRFLRKAIKNVMPYYKDDKLFNEIIKNAEGASSQVFLEQPQTMHEANWADKIDLIDCPTLFVHGEHDDFMPREGSERTAKAIKNCTFMYLANSGHSPMIEIPEVFNKVLFDFLEVEVKG